MRYLVVIIFVFLSIQLFSQGATCSDAEAFCSDTALVFPNTFDNSTAQTGPDYGCLGSQPNPAWYFVGIDSSGDIDLTISQTTNSGAGIDVDFICYGPFTDPNAACNGQLTAVNTVDCSFSGSFTESFTIPNAQPGEFYIVLITNYSGQQGNITFEQTNIGQSTAGETDCSLVCSITLPNDQFFCINTPYTITSQLGNQSVEDTAEYKWFKNGVELVGEENSTLEVNSSVDTTDVYRIEMTSTQCDDISFDEIQIVYNVPNSVDANTFFNGTEPNFIENESIIYCQDTYPELLNLDIVLENNNINDYEITWFNDSSGSTYAINLQGSYSVELYNSINCETLTKTFHVTGSSVFSSTEPNFINEDTYYCQDTYPTPINLGTNIENNDVNNYIIQWSLNGVIINDFPTVNSNPDIAVNETGTYQLTVQNADGCVVSRTVTVLPSSIPVIDEVLTSDTRYEDRVSIEVLASGDGDYLYGLDVDATDLDNLTNYQEENYFNNVLYGVHTVTVIDKNGCGIAQQEVVLVSYPKFITPNNDGTYDTWNIDNEYSTNAQNNRFRATSNIVIFDRFGKIMTILNANGLGWNGMYQGEKAPPGDYWFTVDFTDYSGRKFTKRGHFSLL